MSKRQSDKKPMWKDVVGYEGYYKISDLSNVFSIGRIVNSTWNQRKTKDYILKQNIGIRGYFYVILCANGITKRFYIHRLVAQAFISNPNNKPFINHIDGNKLNNQIQNLEWCTASENLKHAYKIGLKVPNRKGLFGKYNPSSIPILQYSKTGMLISRFEGLKDANRKTGILSSGISSCLHGRYSSSGGFIWKYDKNK